MRVVRMQPVPIRRQRGGFSLLELLIVLAIIGLIAAMVVPNLIGRQQKANIDITRMAIKSLEDALNLYAADHSGEFPQGDQAVAVEQLMQPVDRNNKPMSPYIPERPADAWGEPLYYQFPNDKAPNSLEPAIWSSGPDRKDDNGSNDDINNWTVGE